MNMASEDAPQCIIHQDNVANEEVKRFTSVRWDKWRESVNKWLVLDGHERRLAESAGAGGLTSIMGLLYPECRRKDFKLPPGNLKSISSYPRG